MMPATALPPVIELRQYTLHPGRRDALITLFERQFIEAQQACGMRLLGQFHDQADADRFVWLRGFADMPTRAAALADFYGGPVWRAHRDEANATIIDSDNVLLLRPCLALPRAPAPAAAVSTVFVTLCPLRAPADEALRQRIAEQVVPHLQRPGVRLLAVLETEPAANSFPRLPVREGEPMLVWLVSVDGGTAAPVIDAAALLGGWLRDAPQALHLRATPASVWR